MSNAERQKRYRERNAQDDVSVTRVTPEPERNALALPGDADYVGIPEPPLPGGPGTDEYLMGMHDLDLQLKLKSYQGTDWVNSPEHKEVLRRRQVTRAPPGHEQPVQGSNQP